MDFWPKDTGGGEKAMIQIIEDMTEIESLRQQLVDYKTKHDVACSTINMLQEKCDVRGKALSLQCQETKELRQQLADSQKQVTLLRDALHALTLNPSFEVAKMQSNFSKSHEEMQLERIRPMNNDLPTAEADCVISDLADQLTALKEKYDGCVRQLTEAHTRIDRFEAAPKGWWHKEVEDPHPEIPFGKDAPVIETWEKWMWTIAAAAVVTVLLTSNAFANPEEHRLNQERMLQLQEQQVINQWEQNRLQRHQIEQNTQIYVREQPDYGAIISRAVKQYQDQQRRQQ